MYCLLNITCGDEDGKKLCTFSNNDVDEDEEAYLYNWL